MTNANDIITFAKTIHQEISVEHDLRRMRPLYLIFPKRGTVSLKLSQPHYQHLIRIENSSVRE